MERVFFNFFPVKGCKKGKKVIHYSSEKIVPEENAGAGKEI